MKKGIGILKRSTITRYSLVLILILITGLLASCGGGTSSSSAPPGVNTGIASIVKLLPLQYVAQTNSYLYFKARVLDGNGSPVGGVPVIFTNLTQQGTITAQGVVSTRSSSTVAYTDGYGYATARLFSSEPGFITVLAEVDTGTGKVRDRKTVYFTSSDTSIYLLPHLTLDVDSLPGNGIYNERSDFYLFEDLYDDSVEILATVYDRWNTPAEGETIFWTVDQLEITSDWSGNMTTNTDGQAKILIQAIPLSLRDTVTFFNIYAEAPYVDGVGAANMVSLFMNPVEIDKSLSKVTASPPIINTEATSTISAIIFMNTGEPVFDGLSVNFSVAPKSDTDPDPCGSVTPFAQTTGGIAQATFTAPQVPGVCTITASVRGEPIGSVDVTVTTELMVFPEGQTIDGVTGGTATYTIYGGVPPYNVFSDDPTFPPVPANVSASGDTFTVTVPPATPDTTVTYTIVDSAMSSVTATLNIVSQVETLTIIPDTQTLTDPAVNDTAEYTILGGVAPYAAYSDNPTLVGVNVSGSTLTATVLAVPLQDTTVKITVYDAFGNNATATLILDIAGVGALDLIPDTQTISDPVGGEQVEYTILGGVAPYNVYSDQPGLVDVTVDPNTATVTATVVNVPATDTTVTITVYDSVGDSDSATLEIVFTQVQTLTVSPQSLTLTGFANTAPNSDGNPADDITFYILGGTAPYNMYSDNDAIIASQGVLGSNTFTVDPDAVSTSTTVTITVADSDGNIATASVTVTPPTSSFTLNPSSISVLEGDSVDVYILGGLGPYNTYTTDGTGTCVPAPGGGTLSAGTPKFTVNTQAGCAGQTHTITLEDSTGALATFTITIGSGAFAVSSTLPANGDTGVPVDTPVVITWNRDVDCTTVNTASIIISPAPATSWTLSNCGGAQAVFQPTGQSTSTTYTVTVSTSVQDTLGVSMLSSYVFSYTTAP